MKTRLLISALLLAAATAAAQDIKQDKYLMPSFAEGTVYFRGQMPARGQLNISAEDHSLRFLDKDGKELEATNPENIIMVQIDTVSFQRYHSYFYRRYPFKADMGVAVLKIAVIQRDVKQGAYGMTSQTTAIRETSTFFADGVQYQLDTDKDKPYKVSETVFLYKGDQVYPLNKRGLKKLFPEAKDKIDAWFKAGNTVPEDVPGALTLLETFQ